MAMPNLKHMPANVPAAIGQPHAQAATSRACCAHWIRLTHTRVEQGSEGNSDCNHSRHARQLLAPRPPLATALLSGCALSSRPVCLGVCLLLPSIRCRLLGHGGTGGGPEEGRARLQLLPDIDHIGVALRAWGARGEWWAVRCAALRCTALTRHGAAA